jgi:hypothetical protein
MLRRRLQRHPCGIVAIGSRLPAAVTIDLEESGAKRLQRSLTANPAPSRTRIIAVGECEAGWQRHLFRMAACSHIADSADDIGSPSCDQIGRLDARVRRSAPGSWETGGCNRNDVISRHGDAPGQCEHRGGNVRLGIFFFIFDPSPDFCYPAVIPMRPLLSEFLISWWSCPRDALLH